ncbi:MAG: 2-oxo acid dehydrogenase subunit E2, partial [Pedococcus sp.]
MTAFGPNEWLVDELYEQYKNDKNSVDKAWWAFFADYQPTDGGAANGSGSNGTATPTPAAPAAPAPAPAAPAPAPPAPAASAAPAAPAPAAAPAPTSAAGVQKQATTTDKADARTDKATADKPEDKEAGTGGDTAAAKQVPKPREPEAPKAAEAVNQDEVKPLRGASARTVTNMETSLTVPTATSVRAVPAKLLIDNRVVINNHLQRSRGGKVSFTHLIGYALVKALGHMPEMNNGFREENGKPAIVIPGHVNLGLAIDMAKPDGTRQLLVPSIKSTETMDFAHFWTAYEDVVRKARANKLTVEDFQGTTLTLTNPGTIGTVHSVPRLMAGQGAIIGVGALEYPAEWQGASQETLNRNAVSKILTITSTYDHRII